MCGDEKVKWAVIACFPKEESGALASALGSEGYQVEVACDEHRAVACCIALDPAVLVCDIGMPAMAGIHVLKLLGEYARRPKILCVAGGTDYSPAAPIVMAEFYGAGAVLHRPVDGETFLRALRDVTA